VGSKHCCRMGRVSRVSVPGVCGYCGGADVLYRVLSKIMGLLHPYIYFNAHAIRVV
jgi:hypothetical protein